MLWRSSPKQPLQLFIKIRFFSSQLSSSCAFCVYFVLLRLILDSATHARIERLIVCLSHIFQRIIMGFQHFRWCSTSTGHLCTMVAWPVMTSGDPTIVHIRPVDFENPPNVEKMWPCHSHITNMVTHYIGLVAMTCSRLWWLSKFWIVRDQQE